MEKTLAANGLTGTGAWAKATLNNSVLSLSPGADEAGAVMVSVNNAKKNQTCRKEPPIATSATCPSFRSMDVSTSAQNLVSR